MNKYKIIQSTNGAFNGKVIECDGCIDIQKLSELLNKDFESALIIQIKQGYMVQNEHFTLKFKEVN